MPVKCLSVSAAGNLFAAGCNDGAVTIWSYSDVAQSATGHNTRRARGKEGDVFRRLRPRGDAPPPVAIHPGGGVAVAGWPIEASATAGAAAVLAEASPWSVGSAGTGAGVGAGGVAGMSAGAGAGDFAAATSAVAQPWNDLSLQEAGAVPNGSDGGLPGVPGGVAQGRRLNSGAGSGGGVAEEEWDAGPLEVYRATKLFGERSQQQRCK